ncbi:THUMP domain-containing class I SAM-dependent RNA methyltransferase [Bacillus testis]|uniref:THUMP domain-containing class I SAM-dependent RNA methyltransferase n=1 Tax=Bacillus testis TaxID=1622072 RepID=UPI00067F2568|nr:class I SAM-dependent RNA methyltransferase [Bacillus testis]
MAQYTIIATAAMGLEAIVAQEVRDLGYECTVDNGRVTFKGDEKAIARANMWLRTADRIKIEIGRFKAFTFEELFEQTKKLPWENFITEDGEFPVSGKSVKSKLYSISDCQAIVKKAIVERLKVAYKRIAWFEENGPLFKIEISMLKDVATLTLDTSGVGLHKRGYRAEQGEAPLKETLAAALILISRWTPDRPLIDPFCGSGTIPIEAALIGQNIAPGFNREFVSEQWPWIPASVWEEVREEADQKANYDQPLNITGCDIDHRMIEIAKKNSLEAGLGDLITFKQMQVSDLTINEKYEQSGVLIGNPPYGERLGDKPEVEKMYRDMGRIFSQYETWSVYMLTSHEGFERFYGKPATKKRKLFNGFIRTDFYQYWGKRPKRKERD